jgi:hypothetical protein
MKACGVVLIGVIDWRGWRQGALLFFNALHSGLRHDPFEDAALH